MNKYVRLTQGLNDKGILVRPEEVNKHIKNWNKDHYTSIHRYSDKHLEEFKKTGTVARIKDVETNLLAFDFDCKEDLNKARQDCLTLIGRLRDKLHLKGSTQLEIYFSGMKGFTICLAMDKNLPPFKIAHLALNVLGEGLTTLDPSLYNASRIMRIPNTKHQDSGLFKVQLSYKELQTLTIDDIKELALEARETTPVTEVVAIPDAMVDIKEPVIQATLPPAPLDLSRKPKNWTNCKWSVAQGNFKNGERHNMLMALAATCRGLSFTKEIAFDMCNGALKRSVEKYGQGSTDEVHLRDNIIETVFSDTWQGGQFTCKVAGPLQKYCDELGEHKCKDRSSMDEPPFVQFDSMFKDLVEFSKNFENNILKTGLVQLDDKLILSTSTLNGLLGQPGAGKTTMAMNYLKHSSKQGISSVFFSLDMGKPIVTAKIIQQRIGLDFIQALNFVKTQPEEAAILGATIMKEDYANVNFNFKAGLTAQSIRDKIAEQEEISGKKVKLVIIDYLECIAGPHADATANTGAIANMLKDVANELDVCILLLLQTQKHSTPEVSDPLTSLKGVKGSSVIEQSCTTILTLWREGYSPRYVDDDRYISFAIVKNRFGSLWTGDFSWNGLAGSITPLTEEQRYEFKQFRQRKKDDKRAELEESSKGWE